MFNTACHVAVERANLFYQQAEDFLRERYGLEFCELHPEYIIGLSQVYAQTSIAVTNCMGG